MPWGIIVTFQGQCATWARVAFVAGVGCSGLAAQSSPPLQFTDVTPKAYPGSPDLLYRNDGNGFLHPCDAGGAQIMAAMCISLGDYDNDGWLDLYISDFQKSSDHLWHNGGKGFFDDVSGPAGSSCQRARC